MRFVVALLVAGAPALVHADCATDAARMKAQNTLSLPVGAIEARSALFLRLCERSGGTLVDGTNPALAGRFEPPDGPKNVLMTDMEYPSWAKKMHLEGTVVLAFLVDVDGSVHEQTVIQSSGNEAFDRAALKCWEDARFTHPARLDGRPVPTLMPVRVRFKI